MIFPDSEMNNLTPWKAAESGRDERSIKSAERTLALFEYFSLCQAPQTIGQIVRALSIPQPSVTMLVRNLVRLGYLEQNRTERTYLPTVRIMLLGSWLHRQFHLGADIEVHLDALRRACDETVLLGIQNSLYCQYVWVQMADQPQRMEVQSGMLRPMTRTALGRVLLSGKSDLEISLLVRRSNAELAEDLHVNLGDLMRQIEDVRRLGYAESNGEMSPGLSVIAVPLPPLVGNIPMAVGVGGNSVRIREKKEQILSTLTNLQGQFGTGEADLRLVVG